MSETKPMKCYLCDGAVCYNIRRVTLTTYNDMVIEGNCIIHETKPNIQEVDRIYYQCQYCFNELDETKLINNNREVHVVKQLNG